MRKDLRNRIFLKLVTRNVQQRMNNKCKTVNPKLHGLIAIGKDIFKNI